ncbi:MAG: hypothetical protein MRERC_3c115 [Mycoplasmataceae bacterium RC_NB112A]|nr:MAG: hypothetical protein MRERC_12c059 [Mycoplasmataceae bacterium RC_NB112A]KLL02261.1 MAG: hypothetical protein MRERC_3c115 [Mycoplasmataceae bacterium RC_NB112A]
MGKHNCFNSYWKIFIKILEFFVYFLIKIKRDSLKN